MAFKVKKLNTYPSGWVATVREALRTKGQWYLMEKLDYAKGVGHWRSRQRYFRAFCDAAKELVPIGVKLKLKIRTTPGLAWIELGAFTDFVEEAAMKELARALEVDANAIDSPPKAE